MYFVICGEIKVKSNIHMLFSMEVIELFFMFFIVFLFTDPISVNSALSTSAVFNNRDNKVPHGQYVMEHLYHISWSIVHL